MWDTEKQMPVIIIGKEFFVVDYDPKRPGEYWITFTKPFSGEIVPVVNPYPGSEPELEVQAALHDVTRDKFRVVTFVNRNPYFYGFMFVVTGPPPG